MRNRIRRLLALEDLFASDEQWEKAVEEFPEKMRHFSGFAAIWERTERRF